MSSSTRTWAILTQQLFPALKPFEHVATNLGKNWVSRYSGYLFVFNPTQEPAVFRHAKIKVATCNRQHSEQDISMLL